MEMLWVTSCVVELKPKTVVATVRAYGVESEIRFEGVEEFRRWWGTSNPDVKLVVVKLHGKPVLASDLLLGRPPEDIREDVRE